MTQRGAGSVADTDVEVRAPDVPEPEVRYAREKMASLASYVSDPLIASRLTLRRMDRSTSNPLWVADASVVRAGRLLAAHEAAPSPRQATDAVVDHLRRQLRRVKDADIALRNEPRTIRRALDDLRRDRQAPAKRLKAPEARRIVHRRVYGDELEPTLSAVADLLDLDQLFHLFRHVRTEEDVVVYRREDDRIGLIHPQGSLLADENDIVIPQPSRYSEPISLAAARSEMDVVNHRFLYFIDLDDGRGTVLYLRYDGDYGLVEPA
jgi:ribosome-associated translation inhibitor RaiA